MVLDLEGIQQQASRLAQHAQAGDRLYLHGELGAGKTTFVRAILEALGYSGRVKSPTYNWIDLYPLPHINVAHFDLYRLNSPDDWHELGLLDYLSPPWFSLVEWPNKARLPTPMLMINLAHVDHPEHRKITLTPQNPRGETWLKSSEYH